LKKIGFIGAYDKTDLMIYVAKILVENQKKILIIDATTLQKSRYTVPCIAPSKYYITTYEDIDIAVGFKSIDEIQNYLHDDKLDYDFVFVDTDDRDDYQNFELKSSEKNFFVTGFDNYSLKRGLEIINNAEMEKQEMTKILFSRDMSKVEDEYLNFLSFYYPVKWNKQKIYFPYEVGDNSVIIDNQRNSKISFKDFSQEYKDGIQEIVALVAPDIKQANVKKILKNV